MRFFNALHLLANVWELADHAIEIIAGNAHELDVIESRAGRRADVISQEANFAEIIAARKIREHHLAAGMRLCDLHEPYAHEIKIIGGVPLPANYLPGGETDQLNVVAQAGDEFVGEPCKNGHAAQGAIEGSLAVRLVKRRAKILVALHDVEHVAQHFEHRAIRLGADSGGTRIQTHARHFAEEVSGAQLSNRIFVGEIHRRVNVDVALIRVFFAFIGFARGELTGELAEKSTRAALGFDVRDGSGNRNSRFPFDDVKSRGAIFAFTTYHIAALEMTADHGAAI